MAEKTDKTETTTTEAGDASGSQGGRTRRTRRVNTVPLDVKKARTVVARVVWAVCVVAALVLAVAALFISLDANADNSFVELVLTTARDIDLGVFDLDNPIKGFGGDNAETKTALFNYGIGAVVYLVVGRILERIIRP